MNPVCIGRKRGFTTVELVVVIAVIAVLAAVLIPTFSSVIKNGKKSMDIAALNSANKMLVVEDYAGDGSVSYEQAKAFLEAGGFAVPHACRQEGYSFYWLPDKDRVVLYEEDTNQVIAPEEYQSLKKTSKWISLSEGASVEESTPESEPESEPEEEEDENAHVLKTGEEFRKAITGFCSNSSKIVFGLKKNYKDYAKGDSVVVSSDGKGIKAYKNGTTVYVLCKGTIKANVNSSSMFAGLTSLETVEFENFSTSNVTNMTSMFSGCTKLANLNLTGFDTAKVTSMKSMFSNCTQLTQVDLTGFNTAKVTTMESMFQSDSALTKLDLRSFNTAKVTDMKNMFNGCSNLKNIYVVQKPTQWNVGNVTSSTSMLDGCTKLPNYNTISDTLNKVLAFFGFDPVSTHDKTFATTDMHGYLTEAT